MGMKKLFTTQKEIKDIATLYRNGKSTHFLSKKYGCDRSVIRRVLSENQVEMRDMYDRCKRYNVNEEYFKKIDTEEKAYWLGFLFADGCIKNNGNSYSVCLQLAEKDKNTIAKFKKSITSEHPIVKYYDKRVDKNYYGIYVSNFKFAENLMSVGCLPRKTFDAIFPFDKIAEDLIRHFIRGYFDGDGCVTRSSNKYKYPIANLCLSKKSGEQLQKYVLENFNITSYLGKSRSIHCLNFSTQQALAFLRWIYNDSNIYMERKYKRFLRALADENNRVNNRKIPHRAKRVNQYDENMNLIAEYVSIKQASDKTGVGYQVIGNCCRKNTNTHACFKWRFKNEI